MRFKPFNLAPDKAFLIMAVLFGLAYLAITPPFMVPDEREHFYRAYSISEGQLTGATALLPRSVVDFAEPSRAIPGFPKKKISLGAMLAAWNTPLQPDQLGGADFPGASVYSPLVYLPHVMGILLGRLLQLSPLLIFYSGRLTSFAAWLFLSLLAVRTTPIAKWLFVVLLLMPQTVFQGASLSADTTTLGVCFLFIAFCLRLALDSTTRVGRKELGLLALFFILLPLTKAPYALLTLLFFLIPVDKFGSQRWYWLTAAGLFILTVVPTVLVTTAGMGAVSQFHQGAPDPAEQLSNILQNPWGYVQTVGRTVGTYYDSLEMMFIGYLGWLEVRLPQLVYYTYPLLILLAALSGGLPAIQINPPRRLAFLGIFGLTLLGIYTTLYLAFTSPSAPVIEGVQGRYLIPFSALLFLPLYNRRFKINWSWAWMPVLLYIAAALVLGLVGVVTRYYVR